MLRAVGELRDYGKNITEYRLRQEDGLEKWVSVAKIKKALELNLVQISNLKLKNKDVAYKGIPREELKKYGLMDEEIFWVIISKLSDLGVNEAAKELERIVKYELPIEKAIAFKNREDYLIQQLHKSSEGKMIAFMRSVLRRCSDDQYTDFKYCVMWAGKDIYYKIVNSKSTKQMIEDLRSYVDILDSDAELFGYACQDLIDFGW